MTFYMFPLVLCWYSPLLSCWKMKTRWISKDPQGNIPTIVVPTSYALVPPLDEHLGTTLEGFWLVTQLSPKKRFQEGMMFDNKESVVEAVWLYHIRWNVEHRIKTSNQTVISLKCKRGYFWKLRAILNSYSSS